ncbi:hypothetical protein GS429_17040 [Natronorubrum sp. JWXQ-INN-674]|uniref:Uncharacterized protein n=1 Tax=Natronorubrum halalkaliphilum TaxID=2691917 RepID=A0A6B0VQJ2_9EURY|nr:hypothetical protein [Natronorubrum halalkaliphilum]MXV63734.1 hypothetical protein [Natronorubrum halalkaliphilum]
MAVPFLEWFRDDDGWAVPDGRRGELVGIVLCLPVFLFLLSTETGIPNPAEHPVAVVLGTLCGFCYAVYWRRQLLSAVSERIRNFAISFFFGGLGLSLLRIIHIAETTAVFVLAACGTVVAIYAVWLLSPMHDGVRPPRRGVEPPAAADLEQ